MYVYVRICPQCMYGRMLFPLRTSKRIKTQTNVVDCTLLLYGRWLGIVQFLLLVSKNTTLGLYPTSLQHLHTYTTYIHTYIYITLCKPRNNIHISYTHSYIIILYIYVLHTYIHIHTYTHTSIPSYIRTYIIHTYIHTYTYTHIHTYVHTHCVLLGECTIM